MNFSFYFSSSLEKSLLVMENLFYECDIKNKFDLKGSERNRLVDPLNQQQGDIVLLDENLVQSISIFLRKSCPNALSTIICGVLICSVLVETFVYTNAQ